MNEEALVRQVLAGQAGAIREFVTLVTPILQRAAARVLHHNLRSAGRPELLDLVQALFVQLLERPEQTLGRWDPQKGRNLAQYLTFFAQKRSISILRGGPHREVLAHSDRELDGSDSPMDGAPPANNPEEEAYLREVLAKFQTELSADDLALLECLHGENNSTQEICAALKLSEPALYQRKHRLKQRMRAILQELEIVKKPQ